MGAGGHARAVVTALLDGGHELAAYVDPNPCDWLEDVPHLSKDEELLQVDAEGFVIGLGGADPAALVRRRFLFERYLAQDLAAPPVIHAAATVSDDAALDPGAVLLAAAVVQPAAHVGAAAIINTGAIVEHDCQVGAGSHVAPGAVLLGGCEVGENAMIGAGAVLLPGAQVQDGVLVPAATRYPA